MHKTYKEKYNNKKPFVTSSQKNEDLNPIRITNSDIFM